MRRLAVAVFAGGLAAAAAAAPAPLGEVLQLSPVVAPGTDHTNAQIARMPDGGFVAAWYTSSDAFHDVDVVAQVFGADGTPATPLIEVNQLRAGIQILASVDVDAEGNFAITWRSSDGEPDYGHRAIYARRFDRAGVPRGGEFRVDTLGHDYLADPALSMAPDGRFVVTWLGGASVYARLYDAAGQPRGPEREVQVVYGDAHPDVVMRDDGSFVVVYADNSVHQSIAMRGFDADGQPLFGRVQVSVIEDNPDVFGALPSIAAQADGGFYVAWWRYLYPGGDAYVRRYDAAGAPLGEPLRVSEGPAVFFVSVGVSADGAATVGWTDGDYKTLYARSLDAAGNLDGAPFLVSAPPDSGYSHAGFSQNAIAYDGAGDFVMVWYRGPYSAVYGRFYGPGSPEPDPGGEPPPDDDPGCDHDTESDADHDNGCGNDGRDESDADHDRGYGNDEPAETARAAHAPDKATTAGGFGLATLLLLGATALRRRRRSTGAARTSGSPARC